jgi:hypothetical protein
MPYHYHLVLETPEPNLVAGMAWLRRETTLSTKAIAARVHLGSSKAANRKRMMYEGIDTARTSVFVACLGLLPARSIACPAVLAFPRRTIYCPLLFFRRLHKRGGLVIPRRRRPRCAGSDGLETPGGRLARANVDGCTGSRRRVDGFFHELPRLERSARPRRTCPCIDESDPLVVYCTLSYVGYAQTLRGSCPHSVCSGVHENGCRYCDLPGLERGQTVDWSG